METNNWLKREVKKGLKIAIQPTDDPAYLEQPVWAINWFNLKHKWLYNMYNKVAAPFVKRVDGRLIFKGHLLETVAGDEALARQMLLIVTYPDIHHFLDMIVIKTFQIISMMRLLAVKDFIFGFTRKQAISEGYDVHHAPDKAGVYLVHHFTVGAGTDNTELENIISPYSLELFFSGTKIGIIQRMTANKNTPAPFFMDGINLIKATDRAQLNQLLEDSGFKQLLEGNTDNYLGIFKREK
jgi:uncharacterized protein (DUF1330 family)